MWRGFQTLVPRNQTVASNMSVRFPSKGLDGGGELTVAKRQASAGFDSAHGALDAVWRVAAHRHQHVQADEFGCHGGRLEGCFRFGK